MEKLIKVTSLIGIIIQSFLTLLFLLFFNFISNRHYTARIDHNC